MAGDWIKVECATPDKPEVYRMAEMLGIAPEHVVGCLIQLWVWADQQTTDGNAPGVTQTLADRKSGVPGFADAMLKVGWLEDGDGGLAFPNFGAHNGKTAKSRALTARRVARHKRTGNDEGNGEGNGASVTSALPREEKRRGNTPLTPQDKKPPKLDPTPYQEITEAYNRLCPSLKTCRALNDKRKRRMRKLWQSLMPTLEHWEAYFADCEATDAYAGRFPPRPPYDEPFKADLDFLLRDETVTKVLER